MTADNAEQVTDSDREIAAEQLADLDGKNEEQRQAERDALDRRHAREREADHTLHDLMLGLLAREAARERRRKAGQGEIHIAPPGAKQQTGNEQKDEQWQSPFSTARHEEIRRIWRHYASPKAERHNAERLQFILPRGDVATVTPHEITGADAGNHDMIRAGIHTAALLWKGAHVSGDRAGQLFAAAYGKREGIKVTTEAHFTDPEIRAAMDALHREDKRNAGTDWKVGENTDAHRPSPGSKGKRLDGLTHGS